MIINGKKYDSLKDALPDIKSSFPFMTLERLNNIKAGRPDRLSGAISIVKEEKGEKLSVKKLLRLLEEQDYDTFLKVKNIINKYK